MLDRYLIPDRIFNNIYEITPEFLTSLGIKAVALDIDNTLVTYDDPEPTPSVLEWFDSLQKAGISIAFVSNNEHERVEIFNRSLGFYAHGKSGKPGGKYIHEAMDHMGSEPKNTAFIGDQLLTDVAAGRLAGLHCFLVPPIKDKTTPFFRFKRMLEKPYIRKYHKQNPKEESK